jgi:hypothetical protein
MQEGLVGWDLISLYTHMSREEKIFVLYLVLVLAFSLLRSWKLVRKLWFFSRERRGSSHQPNLGAADLLAAGALANKLARAKDLSDESQETYLQIVEAARPRFDYLWEQSAAKVVLMKNLSILTLILSGLVLSYYLMRFIAIWPIPSCGDCSGGPAELFVPFVLGLAVSAVLYALSSFFAGTLARRRAEWNLFVAKVNDQYKGD